MSQRPRIALKVNDLASGVAFCTDCLGFTLDEEQAGDDRAILVDEDGDHICALISAGPTY